MPRRHTFIQQVRGREPVLLVDGGACLFGTPTKRAPSRARETLSLRDARLIVEAYDFMGYHAMGLGPADIQFGIDPLKKLLRNARFSVVCANLVEAGSREPVFEESVIVEVEGVRFGIYGVLLSGLNRDFKERVLGKRYELLDATETTRRVVPELRKHCDVVVALSHLNMDENREIAETVEGIDVLIDPYSQLGNKTIWVTGDYIRERGETAIVRIDGQGSRVGVFEMTFGPDRELGSYAMYDYPLEPQIFSHPELARFIDKGRQGRSASLSRLPDTDEVHLLDTSFLGQELCGACHEAQHAFWKSTRHSSAYRSLLPDQSQYRYECIECHTVAYGVAYVDPAKVGEFKDVQCESCHGVRPEHAEDPRRHAMGSVDETACWGCHNPSFTGKPFDIEEALKNAACPKMVEKP